MLTKKFGRDFIIINYASAFRRRRHYVFCCPSVRPSVRPSEAWNTLFWPVHGSVGPPDQPWPFYGMSVHLPVRPERFPGICRGTHGGNGLKFYMLMCLDHLRNWLVYGHCLLIFIILALFWLCETGQIWGFRGISLRTHGGNGLKYDMLLYPDHLQNWLDYDYGLVIF